MGLLVFTLASDAFSKQQLVIPLKCLSLQTQGPPLYWQHSSNFIAWSVRACGVPLPGLSASTSHLPTPATLGLFFSVNTSGSLRSWDLFTFSSLSQTKLSSRYLFVSGSNFIQVPLNGTLSEKSPLTCSLRKRCPLLLNVFYALPLLFFLGNCSHSSLAGALSVVFNALSPWLQQCSVHSRCSIGVCGMNGYIDRHYNYKIKFYDMNR